MVNVILAMTKKYIDLLLIKCFFKEHYVFCGLNKKTESLVNNIIAGTTKGKDTSGKWVWMDVFAKRDGKWVAVRSQAAMVK